MTERADPGLRERLEQQAEILKANRLEVHADACDPGEVPCVSPICALEYEAEKMLREAAATLARVERLVEQWENEGSSMFARDLRRALRPSVPQEDGDV